jgi:hypothetical protein
MKTPVIPPPTIIAVIITLAVIFVAAFAYWAS